MSHWRLLLARLRAGLERLHSSGRAVPDWVLGGGTALMIRAGHRSSKDIDAFIDDPQYLSMLSPRLGGEDVWGCDAYDEAGNYLKLAYPEGEIDFIVAAPISDLPPTCEIIDLGAVKPGLSYRIEIEHPVEIALKKMTYRGSMLKVRDIFDIAVIDELCPDLLAVDLRRVSGVRAQILARLSEVRESFARRELAELEIAEEWRPFADGCLERMREIAGRIPDA